MNPRNADRRPRVAAALAVLLLVSGCAQRFQEPTPTTVLPVPPAEEPADEEPVEERPALPSWHCGEVKRQIYAVINLLAAADAAFSENGTGGADAAAAPDPMALTEAVDDARAAFGPADQAALNAACRLYGQHDAALELWAAGNRGDACDVWEPAGLEAETLMGVIDISALHPLPARFWSAATGDVSEGVGRCLAERAN